MKTAAQARLARRVLAEARLDDVAHDDFVHFLRVNPGAADGFGNDFRAQFRGGKG